ncbi:MAG: ester cyclase [Flavobacterium sp.]|nr:ester cyclase [Flavobacterium sp.]MBP6073332.1 ester cyclase [Flavobacterium sp.]
MKKIVVLLLAGLSITACVSDADKNAAQSKKNVDFYTKVWEQVINEGKVNVLDTAYAESIVLHTLPEIKGIKDAKAYYAGFVTGFSNRKFTVKRMFADGENLVKHWQFTGTHTGVFMGIPATGRTVNIEGSTIAKIVDGKIVEEQDFMDNMSFLKQLGLIQ